MIDFLPWMFDGVGTAVAGFALGRVRLRLSSRASPPKGRETVFTAGADTFMPGFHAHLAAKIGGARQCVYITGDGFEPSSGGDELASQVLAAMRDALSRGVRVVRLQTSAAVNDFWRSQLKTLLADFPHLFELFVLADQAQPQTVNMCAIDVDDEARSVAETWFGLPRFLGTRTCTVGVMAVFTEGHQLLAQSIRDHIIGLCDPAASRRLRTVEAADGYFSGALPVPHQASPGH
jgi:hypothetical protein